MTPAGDTLARMARSIITVTGHSAGRPARGRASGRLSDWFTGEDAESRCREAIQQAENLGLLFRGLKLARARELWEEGISQGYEPGPDFLAKASDLGLCADKDGTIGLRRGLSELTTTVERRRVSATTGRGVDPAARGLPTVPVNWDELADFVEAGNPKGASVAAGFRERAAEQRAAPQQQGTSSTAGTGSPGGSAGPAAGGDSGAGE